MFRKILLVLFLFLTVFAAAEGTVIRSPLTNRTPSQRSNIETALHRLSSVTVWPGDSFSMWDALNPMTVENGFVPAEDDLGETSIGGGVSQIATVLYESLCEYSLHEITFESLTFAGDRFSDTYAFSGSVAVHVDDQTDFRFINRSDTPLIFSFRIEDDAIVCSVYADSIPVFSGEDRSECLAESAIPCGDDLSVLTNVQAAADSINDLSMTSGDVFSFNKLVGPRTAANGFVPAVNGRGVRVTGGGVAQVASAIWLCIQGQKDFEILSKSTYGKKYNGQYVEHASDAILTDYDSGIDFSFRYTGTGCVTFYLHLESGSLFCSVEQT